MGNLCTGKEEVERGVILMPPSLTEWMREEGETRNNRETIPLREARVEKITKTGDWSLVNLESHPRHFLWKGPPLEPAFHTGQTVDVDYFWDKKQENRYILQMRACDKK